MVKAARYPGLTLRVLGDGEPAMGPGKAKLIELIDATGSISAAAREMGMSYRRAWQLVDALNTSFTEPVVLTATGGRRGGGAVVTGFGKRLADDFRKMEARASAAIASDIERYTRQLRRVTMRRRLRRE
jgi:molybdate transport system regulatory protein